HTRRAARREELSRTAAARSPAGSRAIDFKAEAHRDPWSVPLDEIDVSNPYLYSEDTWHGFFARLRRDDPVHFVDSPMYGPFWSVTRYRDIMTVDTSHQVYSSEA